MMPHTMYFTGDSDTVTKINHVPYQTIAYNDNGVFTAKLMNDTSIEIFIDNRATPSILPLCTNNKFPILHTYPKTESNTPIHTGGSLITSHFWLEIPLKLEHQTIQIKALACYSDCPYFRMNIYGTIICMVRLRITQIIPSTDFDPIDSYK